VGLAYGATESASAPAPRRMTYLIDPGGQIRASWGTSSKIDVKVHAEEVLSAIPAPG
jgi:peroxiredoxin